MQRPLILLILLAVGLGNFALAQQVLPGFRGWVYSSPPPNQALGVSSWLETNFNRAQLSWYIINPEFYYQITQFSFPESDLSNHYSRQITPNEVFPHQTNITGDNLLNTFNLRFIPDEPGPYNFGVLPTNTSAGIDSEGKLLAPETRWAGMMRRFADPDLPAQGIDSISFWLLDPFLYNSGHNGLTLTFQIGDVNEDVLMDNILNFENSLWELLDSNEWGWYPISLLGSHEFPEDDKLRGSLDVGLDGISDDNERLWFKTVYLDRIATAFGQNSNAYLNAWEDPSRDNFKHIDDASWNKASIVDRYSKINRMEGNSAVLEPFDGRSGYSSLPDKEDLNLNGTLNTYESTEDYVLRLAPGMGEVAPFIVDSIRSEVRLINGDIETVTWYHFRFPLVKDGSNLSLDDFRNVAALRLMFSDCSEPVTLRFVESPILNICEPFYSTFNPIFEESKAIPFPNPFDNQLQFNLQDKGDWPSRLQLWDTQGRLVDDFSDYLYNSSYYPGDQLRPGVYVFELNTINAITGKTGIHRGKVFKMK